MPAMTVTVRTLSEVFEDLKAQTTSPEISIENLLNQFHERGFGFFLFIIALPAALPIPALGINTIIALPLLLLTAQQAMGFKSVWLPQKWCAKTIKTSKIHAFIEKAKPWVKRLEFFICPRLSFITQGVFSHLIGIAGFFMALSVAVPLPLTNTVPSFGIALMAIGVLMRDGLAVLGGMIIGITWVIFIFGFLIIFGAEGIDMVKEFIKGFI